MNRSLLITFAGAAMLSLAAPLLASFAGILNPTARAPYVGADASAGSASGSSGESSGGATGGGGGH
jgi:hypothetical protein